MADPGSRAEAELKLVKDFYERGLDLLVEMLAVKENLGKGREQLKAEVLRYVDPFGIWRRYFRYVDPAEVRNVLFDVARLHVDTLQDLMRISQRYTDHVAERLAAQRATREATAERATREAAAPPPRRDQPREIVRLLQWDPSRYRYHATFSIGEGLTREQTVRFPEAMVVYPSDNSGEFPIAVRFEPDTVTLRPERAATVSILVPQDDWLRPGLRYGGTLVLGASSEAPVKLLIRLAPA